MTAADEAERSPPSLPAFLRSRSVRSQLTCFLPFFALLLNLPPCSLPSPPLKSTSTTCTRSIPPPTSGMRRALFLGPARRRERQWGSPSSPAASTSSAAVPTKPQVLCNVHESLSSDETSIPSIHGRCRVVRHVISSRQGFLVCASGIMMRYRVFLPCIDQGLAGSHKRQESRIFH